MSEPTTADFVRALRVFANVADRSAMHPECQHDASVHALRALAALAGADALEQLHTTRQRLDDLQGEYELTKGNFADFAEQQLERNRQHAVQIEEMDRVVSLAHATAAEARQQLKQLRSLMEAYIAEHDAIQPWEWAERFIVALDQPKAQEANP